MFGDENSEERFEHILSIWLIAIYVTASILVSALMITLIRLIR